jgi:aspartate ammonia-lyase
MNSYIGNQTQKALENFPFSGNRVHLELIYAIVIVKKAAALANLASGNLDSDKANAIVVACDEITSGKFNSEFSLPGLQGGAGTSMNMNVNEVIAIRATEILKDSGKEITVHPNDHVNKSQSTNDVNPSALKLAILMIGVPLLKQIDHIVSVFMQKADEWQTIRKLARTHLQDAVPITLGDEFKAYAAILKRDQQRIEHALSYCYELNLGGTAVGNAINASVSYREKVYLELNRLSGFDFRPAENLMSQTSSQTDFLTVSHALVSLTLDASKIASDIRLLTSGPIGGIGELILTELQSGSSIMPGKVNPVLPESVNQLFYLVSGNNLTIEHAAHASQLELGVMFPIFADNLITSLKLTGEVLTNFADHCVVSIVADQKRCKELLEKSSAYATLLTPILGYDTVSKIVKESITSGKSLRELVVTQGLMSDAQFDLAVNI